MENELDKSQKHGILTLGVFPSYEFFELDDVEMKIKLADSATEKRSCAVI